MAKRKRGGMLTSLSGKGASPKKKKPRSPATKALRLLGGIVVGAAFVVMVGILVVGMFNPKLGETASQETVAIQEIRKDPTAPDGSTAFVILEGRETPLPPGPVPVDQLAVDDKVKVDYLFRPRAGAVIIQAWDVVRDAETS